MSNKLCFIITKIIIIVISGARRCNSKLSCAFRDINQTVFQLYILHCLCVEVSILGMKDIIHRGNFWLVYGLFHNSHFVIDRDVSTHTAVMVGRFTERNFKEHGDYIMYLRLVHYEPHRWLHAVLALLVTMDIVISFTNV